MTRQTAKPLTIHDVEQTLAATIRQWEKAGWLVTASRGHGIEAISPDGQAFTIRVDHGQPGAGRPQSPRPANRSPRSAS